MPLPAVPAPLLAAGFRRALLEFLAENDAISLGLKRNFQVMSSAQWLEPLVRHIPDRYEHLVLRRLVLEPGAG